MYCYVEHHNADVSNTDLISDFRVWNEIRETHEEVDKHEVCALVESLLH